MPCGDPCTCLPGYVECAPNTCCLRYKNMARRFSKALTQLKQKHYHTAAHKYHVQKDALFKHRLYDDEDARKIGLNSDEQMDDSRPIDEKSNVVKENDRIDYGEIRAKTSHLLSIRSRKDRRKDVKRS